MIIVENIRNRRESGFKTSRNKEYCTMHNSKDLCAIKKRSRDGELYNKFPTQTELHTKLFKIAPKGVIRSSPSTEIVLDSELLHMVLNLNILKILACCPTLF